MPAGAALCPFELRVKPELATIHLYGPIRVLPEFQVVLIVSNEECGPQLISTLIPASSLSLFGMYSYSDST